jgi:NADH-quinone oxidoreductase subunit J
MNVEMIGFFFLASLLVGFSLLVIFVSNPVHSALALIAALFVMAVLFLTLNAPMVAALQILVYAGAIMVLFLFVVMLLNPGTAERKSALWWAGGSLASALLVLELLGLLIPRSETTAWPASRIEGPFGSPEALGHILFNDFVLPLEIASVLLLVAIIGAVTLARRVKE